MKIWVCVWRWMLVVNCLIFVFVVVSNMSCVRLLCLIVWCWFWLVCMNCFGFWKFVFIVCWLRVRICMIGICWLLVILIVFIRLVCLWLIRFGLRRVFLVRLIGINILWNGLVRVMRMNRDYFVVFVIGSVGVYLYNIILVYWILIILVGYCIKLKINEIYFGFWL